MMAAAIRVLYVDDEPGLLDIGKVFLEQSGDLTVTTATSAPDAIRLLEQERFDAIISDYQMPEMDGIQFLVLVRTKFGQIPFILFTGKGREEVVIEALNAGADGYLQKGGESGAQFAELSHKVKQAAARKKAEDALKRSEEQYRQLVELAQEGIWAIDAEYNTTYLNPRMAEMLQYTVDEMQGLPLFSFMDDAGKMIFAQKMERRRQGITEMLPFEFITKGGSRIYVTISTSPLIDDKGTYQGSVAVISDITGRKRAEDELLESEERFRLAINATEDGLWEWDILTNSEFFSSRWCEIIGYSFDDPELLHTYNSWAERIHPDDSERVMSALKNHLEKGTNYDVDYRHRHKSGEYRWQNSKGQAIFDERGKPTKMVGCISDITDRKRAEEQLKESETLLNEVGAMAHVGGWELDARTKAVRWTKETYRIHDISEDEKFDLSKAVLFFDLPDRSILEAALQRCMEMGEPFDLELPFTSAKGRHLWTRAMGRAISVDGEVVKLEGTFQDITERKRAEDALVESEARYRYLFDSALDGITVADKTGVIVDCSQSTLDFTGYTKEELLGKHITHDMLPSSKGVFSARFPLLQQNKPVDGEIQIVRKDGSIVEIWRKGYPLLDHAGNFTGALLYDRDITERKRAEDALRESKALVDAVVENVPLMIFLKEATDLRFVIFNRAGEELLGYDRTALLGKNNLDLFPPEQAAHFMTKDREVLDGELSMLDIPEESILTAKKGLRLLHTRKVCIRGIDGTTKFLLGISEDITERKRDEVALRQANKKLNLFSSITRHDILNQLMALKCYIELSHEEIDNPTTLTGYIQKEEQVANAIERQITFTRDYQELGVAAPEWQNVNASIQKAVAGLPMRAVHVDVDRTDLEIFADPLFEKVFYNLIDNALRYGGDQMKTIRFSSQESDTSLAIVCEDDGVGISAEDQKRLFTRGFGKNTGLGLFLSREILSITSITITENGVPGKGARFEITVPNGMWRTAGTGA